jgi:hypothetical protein
LWRKPTLECTSSLKNICPNKYVLEFIPEVFSICFMINKKAFRSILNKCCIECKGILRVYFTLFYFMWKWDAGWCGKIVFKVGEHAFCFVLLTFLRNGRKHL